MTCAVWLTPVGKVIWSSWLSSAAFIVDILWWACDTMSSHLVSTSTCHPSMHHFCYHSESVVSFVLSSFTDWETFPFQHHSQPPWVWLQCWCHPFSAHTHILSQPIHQRNQDLLLLLQFSVQRHQYQQRCELWRVYLCNVSGDLRVWVSTDASLPVPF